MTPAERERFGWLKLQYRTIRGRMERLGAGGVARGNRRRPDAPAPRRRDR
jgi:hypothetical protein